MFNILRRISGSVIPRPDRPWSEDATSNAPQIGKKRRLSFTERDRALEESERQTKKNRSPKNIVAASSVTEDGQIVSTTEDSTASLQQGRETEGEDVKEVTKGVKEVELGDKARAPESVPLPEEVTGELDEPVATPPPDTQLIDRTQGDNAEAEHAPDKHIVDGKDGSSSASSIAPQGVEEGAKEIGTEADEIPGLVTSEQSKAANEPPAEVDSPRNLRARISKKTEDINPSKV